MSKTIPYLLCAFLSMSLHALLGQNAVPSVGTFTQTKTKKDGYLPVYLDEQLGKVYLEVSRLNEEFLLVHYLASGVGSNDIGLDRGQLGGTKLVVFQRYGNKLLLIEKNLKFRVTTDNPAESKAVTDAFAPSVIAGFEIKAQSANSFVIDVTEFLIRDSHGISERLSEMKQGNFKLDEKRSVVLLDEVLNFPRNTELESLVTFVGSNAGNYLRSVTVNNESFTVRLHYSFVQLPDDGFVSRLFHPRSGYFGISYYDYGVPIEAPINQQFIVKHRLESVNPTDPNSPVVKPIIYYLDPGTPEPIRSALLDGGRWWADAFAAAGFPDAFKVEMLPTDAHPLDIRYNVIQWVHRSTRGWSYGSSVVDPRSGEIIKGHVTLGSLRVRQDFLLAQGLLNKYESGDSEMKEMALARLRQLSAHEIGHTLGLAHNYAASANGMTSVMDYPHPIISTTPKGRNLILRVNDAYDDKIGKWDIAAIKYGYGMPAEGETMEAFLQNCIDENGKAGLKFITDRDARATGGAHPTAHLWDNGANAADELDQILKIRRSALLQLSEKSLREGEPISSLEEILVPVYLMHRYQIEAAVKLIGGVNYDYSVKGDSTIQVTPVGMADQRKALELILLSLKSNELAIPDHLLSLIPPKAAGYNRSRESFGSKTGLTFDPVTAAEGYVDFALGLLIHTERLNRLVLQKQRNPSLLGIADLMKVMHQFLLINARTNLNHYTTMTHDRVIFHLKRLATDASAYPEVRAASLQALNEIKKHSKKLKRLSTKIESKKANDILEAINNLGTKQLKNQDLVVYYKSLKKDLKLWLKSPVKVSMGIPAPIPAGAPIGTDDLWIGCE